jgi:hypothetical protein
MSPVCFAVAWYVLCAAYAEAILAAFHGGVKGQGEVKRRDLYYYGRHDAAQVCIDRTTLFLIMSRVLPGMALFAHSLVQKLSEVLSKEMVLDCSYTVG